MSIEVITMKMKCVFSEDSSHRFLMKKIWNKELPQANIIPYLDCLLLQWVFCKMRWTEAFSSTSTEIKPISVGEEQCSVELIFPTANFEKLLKQFRFTNKLKELQSLDEKGFIKKEGKHYSIRRKIAGKKIPVYVLTLPESLLSAKFRNTVEEV